MSVDLNSFVAIPISVNLYSELLNRYPGKVNTVIENVVGDFLDRMQDEVSYKVEKQGLFWEALFLPSQTQIRTKYFGEYKIASIEGNEIIWNGKKYPSMAQLTNSMRGNTSNNAWRELEIKRPEDERWMPAQALRR